MNMCDFTWNKEVRCSSEESLYLNKCKLSMLLRTVNYFENGFLNKNEGRMLGSEIYSPNNSSKNVVKLLLSTRIKRRIYAMADYTYDELRYTNSDKPSDEMDETNIKFNNLCLAIQLFTFYSQGLLKSLNGPEADSYLVSVYYKIINEFKMSEFIDDCIKEANKIYMTDEFVFEREEVDEYSYSSGHEHAIFDTILSRNIVNTYSGDCKSDFSNNIARRLSNQGIDRLLYDPLTNIYNILKKTMMDINASSVDLETKNKLVRSVSKLVNDAMFDKQKELELMKAALVYPNHRRPTMTCKDLFEKNKDKYSYKGIVYHGFINHQGMYNVKKELLERYTDGFISCSKSLKVASGFAGIYEYDPEDQYDTGMYNGGYVIEILIDDDVEAIDLESLLVDMYNESKSDYRYLYRGYRKEKEVLLKLPLVSYRLLSPSEVQKRLRDENKEWDKFNNDNEKPKLPTLAE